MISKPRFKESGTTHKVPSTELSTLPHKMQLLPPSKQVRPPKAPPRSNLLIPLVSSNKIYQARNRSKVRHRKHLANFRNKPDHLWIKPKENSSKPKENSKVSLAKSKAQSRTSWAVSNPFFRDLVHKLNQSSIRSRENSEVPPTSSRQSLVMLRLMPKQSSINSRAPKVAK